MLVVCLRVRSVVNVIEKFDKVITTMVVGLLDDHKYCAGSVFTHLWRWV